MASTPRRCDGAATARLGGVARARARAASRGGGAERGAAAEDESDAGEASCSARRADYQAASEALALPTFCTSTTRLDRAQRGRVSGFALVPRDRPIERRFGEGSLRQLRPQTVRRAAHTSPQSAGRGERTVHGVVLRCRLGGYGRGEGRPGFGRWRRAVQHSAHLSSSPSSRWPARAGRVRPRRAWQRRRTRWPGAVQPVEAVWRGTASMR